MSRAAAIVIFSPTLRGMALVSLYELEMSGISYALLHGFYLAMLPLNAKVLALYVHPYAWWVAASQHNLLSILPPQNCHWMVLMDTPAQWVNPSHKSLIIMFKLCKQFLAVRKMLRCVYMMLHETPTLVLV